MLETVYEYGLLIVCAAFALAGYFVLGKRKIVRLGDKSRIELDTPWSWLPLLGLAAPLPIMASFVHPGLGVAVVLLVAYLLLHTWLRPRYLVVLGVPIDVLTKLVELVKQDGFASKLRVIKEFRALRVRVTPGGKTNLLRAKEMLHSELERHGPLPEVSQLTKTGRMMAEEGEFYLTYALVFLFIAMSPFLR